jgi:hypothetical protein
MLKRHRRQLSNRVTRLGVFSPYGRAFTFGSLITKKNYRSRRKKFGLLFSYVLILIEKMLGYTLCYYFYKLIWSPCFQLWKKWRHQVFGPILACRTATWAGWPDWANFCPLNDSYLWTVFLITEVARFWVMLDRIGQFVMSTYIHFPVHNLNFDILLFDTLLFEISDFDNVHK